MLIDPAPPKRMRPGVREEFGKDVLHFQRTEILVRNRGDGLTRVVLRIGEDLRDVVDRRNRRLDLLEPLDDFRKVVSSYPAANDRIHRLHMPDTIQVSLETRIIRRSRTAGQVKDAPDDVRRGG